MKFSFNYHSKPNEISEIFKQVKKNEIEQWIEIEKWKKQVKDNEIELEILAQKLTCFQ